MSLSAHPLSLDYEQDPDSYLPADPGLFHVQGDDKRKKSHTIVSSLKTKPLLRSGWLILPDAPLARRCCFRLQNRLRSSAMAGVTIGCVCASDLSGLSPAPPFKSARLVGRVDLRNIM